MNRKIYLTLAGVIVLLSAMTGLAAYSVTLYRLFCSVTGAGGTTQRATAAPDQRGRMITVSFDTTTAPQLPWRFVPLQRRVRLRLGEPTIAYFEAENLSDQTIVGRATFNVTPEKIGIYFKKIQCFCFSQQSLRPHEKVSMPVTFFVDPQLAQDANTSDVQEIVLSYTFFKALAPSQPQDLAKLNVTTLPQQQGAQAFQALCAGCHEFARNKVGPQLAGVFGRSVASVPGYPYSAALRAQTFSWDADHLDRWLRNPQQMVPGAAMPMQVHDDQERAAIIAYLRTVPDKP